MAFYKKLFQKTKQIGGGLKFIQENFPTGARQLKKKIQYVAAGGAYGKQMEKRSQATPAGTKTLKSLKTKGFWGTLK